MTDSGGKRRTMRLGSGMLGVGALILFAATAIRGAQQVVLVRAVSSPAMTSVLASTRTPLMAAAKATGVSAQALEDIAAIDACLLETPLDAAEQETARQTIVSQYQQNPQAFVKNLEYEHKVAEILVHGSATEQLVARTTAWLNWLSASQKSPFAARWVATIRRHNSPVAESGGIVVTNRQLDALFVSNDWTANAANVALSTEASRNAYTEALPGRFGSLSQAEKQQLALADLRWFAVEQVVGFGLKDKAVEIARLNVHGPGDVPAGARHLENASIDFIKGMMRMNDQVAARALALMGGTADGAVAESMNMAQDRFEGKFNIRTRH